MKKGVLLLGWAMLTSTLLFAQVPQGFNFQAIARNSNGELLVKTNIEVVVGIRSGSATGNLVWQETHNVTTNEFGLFTLVVCGDDLLRTGGATATIALIDWGSNLHFLDLQIDAGNGLVDLGVTQLRSVPYSLVSSYSPVKDFSTLEIQPRVATEPGEALFIVRREDGFPIFAVYETGVEVYTDNTSTGKGIKGGFAVGGYNTGKKGMEQAYMSVTPDSTRIYVNDLAEKGIKGGFAVGGYNTGKGTEQTYMSITPDSTRIYVNDLPGKSIKGGFAVGGYNTGKGRSQEFLRVTQDSTRVYVNTDAAKGIKGGFAVGGYNTGKRDDGTFMSLSKENYFIGHNSGNAITEGLYNSVLGYESAMNIQTGSNNAFLGYQAGYSNVNGSGNLFLGYQTGYSNVWGENNTFVGNRAGYFTNGPHNTFMGSFAGYKNTTGGLNTFVGDSAGYNNIGGYSNTFMGTSAGLHNTYGFTNLFLGNQAGYSNTTGGFNVFLGFQTGFSSDSGFNNVFVGTEAGYSNVSGSDNTFMGRRAGNHNITGYSNVMIGTDAGLESDSGAFNVFLGHESGKSNTRGIQNVFAGFQSGYLNNKGGNNIYIGTFAGFENQQGEGNVFMGYDAGHNNNGSQNVFIGNRAGSNQKGNGKLHISNQEGDSTKALIFGDFYGPTLRFNARVGIGMNPTWTAGLSSYNAYGMSSISLYGAGDEYNYSGIELHADTSGGRNLYAIQHTKDNAFEVLQIAGDHYIPRIRIDSLGKIGINAYPNQNTMHVVDENGAVQLSLSGLGDANDYAMLSLESRELAANRNYMLKHAKDKSFALAYWNGTDYFTRMSISEYGLFRITDTLSVNGWDATEALDVNGNARFRGVGAIAGGMDLLITPEGVLTTSTSDARMKENIRPLVNSLETIMSLEGITFEWKDRESGQRDAGLIAQDVAKVFPEAVFINPNDGLYGVNYSRFPALFVEAFKEQQELIVEQEDRISRQNDEINELKTRLEQLEQLFESKIEGLSLPLEE